jgi:beta-galactosidase
MFPSRAGAIGQREKAYKDYTMPPELAQVTEVASLNYQSAWYGDFKKHCPNLNIFQSEAETSNWLTAYYNMDREHSIGMAYWGSIEYWGESNGWPKKGWNYSFFSHTMEPYPTAWLVKSAFCEDEPIVRLGVLDASGSESVSWNDIQVGQTSLLSHWTFPASSKQRVYVCTNAPQAELFLNGKSLGIKTNDGKENMQHVIIWDIDYQPGTLLAIACNNEGKEVARHELQTAGKAVKLRIEEETSEWQADGMDLHYLNITAVDSKGCIVPNYDDPLTIDVAGPATLLALDNGNHYTDELFAGITTKKMRGGRMLVILRSKREAGKVVVSATTGKFKTTYKTTTN